MTSVSPLDAAALCDAFEHDLEMIQELVALVARDLPRHVRTLEAAADCGDLVGVRRAAHAIRGAVSNVYAFGLCEIADSLEQAARGEDAVRVGSLRPNFRAASEALLAELAVWPERAVAVSATPVSAGGPRRD